MSSNKQPNAKATRKPAPGQPQQQGPPAGWFEESKKPASSFPTDPDQIKAMLEHQPLAGRTSDPVAADLDQAAEWFHNGVTLFRSGSDKTQGRNDIAAAFLLDSRCIKYIHKLPPHFTDDLKNLCLDFELIQELCQINIPEMSQLSYSSHVLRILAASKFGTMMPTMFAGAMHSVLFLIQAVQKNPELEDKTSGPIHGCLTRPHLFYLQSTIFVATRSPQKALQSLTAAIQIDPGYLRALEARASLWANLKAVDDKTVVAEYKKLIQLVHKDHCGIDVCYAWVALKILINPAMGALQEGNYFHTQAIKAWDRRQELYGKSKQPMPPIVNLVKQQYTAIKGNYDAWTKREMQDNDQAGSETNAVFKIPKKE